MYRWGQQLCSYLKQQLPLLEAAAAVGTIRGIHGAGCSTFSCPGCFCCTNNSTVVQVGAWLLQAGLYVGAGLLASAAAAATMSSRHASSSQLSAMFELTAVGSGTHNNHQPRNRAAPCHVTNKLLCVSLDGIHHIHHTPLLKHGVTCGVCAAGYYTECQAAQHTSNACRPGEMKAELASLCHNLWQLLLGAGGVHQERPEPAHCRPCTLPGTSKKYFC